jgi:radical SAM superfamily enzyme YgiQ (UPF0313 family)
MKIAGLFPQRVSIDPRLDPDPEEPLGIEYVLATARQRGHDVRLFTPLDTPVDRMPEVITEFSPDILAVSMYTCHVPDALHISSKVKESLPELRTVVGGPHPTATPGIVLCPVIDVAVIGEGEETFCDLLDAWAVGRPLEDVSGLALDSGGIVKLTSPRNRISNLDELPLPLYERRYYDLRAASISFPPMSEVVYAPMLFSRGCSMPCEFCSSRHLWGARVHSRSPKNVVEEMVSLRDNYGVNFVYFEDLTFTLRRRLFLSLCDLMIERNINVHWGCETHVSTVHRRELARMARAGCRKILWGIESVDDVNLERMEKRQSIADAQRALKAATDCGILNWGCYIIGFPWDTERSILDAVEVLGVMDIHQLRISIATPFPGSEWYSKISKSALHPDLRLYDTNHLVYDHSSISAKRMKELQNELFVRFYGSREYRDRLGRMIHLHPHLRESVDEWLAYIDTNIEKLAGGTVELTQTLEWQEVQRSYNPLQPVDEPKCKSTKGELEVALRI